MTEILLPNGERRILAPAPGSWQEEMHSAFRVKEDAQFEIDAIEKAVSPNDRARIARIVIDRKNLYTALDCMYANDPAEADRVYQRICEYPPAAYAAALKALVEMDTGKILTAVDHPALEDPSSFVKRVKSTKHGHDNGKGSSTKDLKTILKAAEQKMQQDWTDQPGSSNEERSV